MRNCLFLFYLLASCLTLNEDLTLIVVERSKEFAPGWTIMEQNKMVESENTLTFVGVRSQILDLPLGLKQTQLMALEESQRAIHAIVKSKLSDFIKENNIQISAHAELEKLIADTVYENHSHNAKISDIYYEKLNDPNDHSAQNTFYKIYVLVTYPKEEMPNIIRDLSQRLIQAKDTDLQLLGKTTVEKKFSIYAH